MNKEKNNFGKGLKILVFDDERDICQFSKEYLARRGFDVYTSFTGKAAMTVIKKEKPDIAILDIYVAGEADGMDVLQFLQDEQAACRCVMVTKEDDTAMIDKAKQLGAVGYLTKPLTIKELEEVLKDVVKNIGKGDSS